jgi:hypothetical protein
MMDRLVKKALKTTETVKILYFPKIVFLNRFSGTVLAFIKKRKTFTRGGDTMRNLFKHLVAAAVVGVLSANVFAATTIVYSNNPAPGDQFTNSGPLNQGQAVGTSGWYYNNVRNNGAVGIRTNYPFNGNGSVYMRTPTGASESGHRVSGKCGEHRWEFCVYRRYRTAQPAAECVLQLVPR